MKKIILLSLFAMFGAYSIAQTKIDESFYKGNVENVLADEAGALQLMNNLQERDPEIQFSEEDYQMVHEYYTNGCPNHIAAGLLGIFLGAIGVQHFYVGQYGRGVLDILFCWTGIPELIGLIEGIIWLCESQATFERKFCN